MVIGLSVAAPPSVTKRTRLVPLPLTISLPAPGPLTVTSPLLVSSPVARVMTFSLCGSGAGRGRPPAGPLRLGPVERRQRDRPQRLVLRAQRPGDPAQRLECFLPGVGVRVAGRVGHRRDGRAGRRADVPEGVRRLLPDLRV